jgi:O-antigen/teichoic acid export membrane protein
LPLVDSLHSASPKRLGSELVWIAVGHVAVVLASVVGVRLLTEALPIAVYGELALAMTLTTLAQQTLLGPLNSATLRFFAPAQERGELPALLVSTKHLLYQATAILLVLGLSLVAGLLLAREAAWSVLATLALLFALLSGYGANLDGMQNAARQRVVVSWHGGLGAWLRPLLAIMLIRGTSPRTWAPMTGYVAASFVVLLSQYWWFRRRIMALLPASESEPRGMSEAGEKWRREMKRYAWPFGAWGVFTWVQLASDRWALQLFTTTSETGLYAALYQVGYYPLTMLSAMAMQLLTPIIFARGGDGLNRASLANARSLNRRLLLGGCGTTLAAVGVAAAFHVQICQLLVAPAYRAMSPLLPLMTLSAGLFACGQIASLELMTSVRTRNLVIPKIATAVFGVAANVIGARSLGLRGVAIASVLFSGTYFIWLLCLVIFGSHERESAQGAAT